MNGRPMAGRTRTFRPVWVGLTGALLVLAAYETVLLFGIIDAQQAIGTDLDYYRFVAQRWLDTGTFFTDRQLAGPYVVQTQVDNLYPPHALYLFIPFLVLPDPLWWILPLSFIGYVVWWCRPAAWAWPILALMVAFPKTPGQILFGNTDMWIAAAVAGGVRFGWPAVFATLKPSLIFLAIIGVGNRSWWIAAIVLAAISLPFVAIWLHYPTAMRNSSANALYSLSSLPFFILPIVGWITSTRRGGTPLGPWVARLLQGGPRRVTGKVVI